MATIRELRAKFTATAQGFKQSVQEIQNGMKGVGDEGSKGAEKANTGFGNLKKTLVGFAGAYLGFEAVKGAVGGVISITDQYQKSLNSLQSQTGATDKEMKGMETSLKNIYAGGYGADFQDIADSMALVENATGLTGKALESATKQAIVLRDSMGYDVTESTATASTMMKQFGITSEQAFTLMAQGQQSGLDKNGDMMDSFNEYSVYFKQLGFDAEGMWNVFKAGSDAGAFNMDKVGDAVKEFGIRVKDGSKSTDEAFKGLGMNTDEMAQKFAQGGETSQKALQQVFNELGKIDDPVKRNAIGVQLFGTQFEDLEVKTIQALGTVKDQANMSGDTLKKLDELKFNNIGSAFEWLKRQVIVGLLDPIQKQVMPLLNTFMNNLKTQMPGIKSAVSSAFSGIISIITKLAPTFSNIFTILMNVGSVVVPIVAGAIGGLLTVLGPVVNAVTGVVSAFTSWSGFAPLIIGLATALGTYMAVQKASLIWTNLVTTAVKAWAIAQRALNLVMAMNPVGIVIALIAGLVAVLIYAWQNSETFRNIMIGAWNGIKSAVMAVINWFIVTIPQWIANIGTWFSGLGTTLSNIWTGIKTVAVTVWNGIKTAVMTIIAVWIAIVKAYFTAWKVAITTIFNGLKIAVIAIWNALKTGVMAIVNGWITIVKTAFNLWKTGIITIFNALKTGALAVWNAMKTAIVAVVNAIKNTGTKTFNALKSSVTSIFNSIKSVTTSVWNGIKNAISNAISSARSKVSSTVSSIRSVISSGFNSAKSIAISAFNALKSGVQSAINNVKSIVSGLKSSITGSLRSINLLSIGKNIIQGLINGIKSMAGAVGSAIKNIASNITGKIKGALGIHSPSRVFMEIGEYTGEGLAIGIENMKRMVTDATGTLADASIGTINDAEVNPITTTVNKPGDGQDGQGGTNYNAPLMHIDNYYQNDNTDVRSISNGLYNLQRNSDRKKGK